MLALHSTKETGLLVVHRPGCSEMEAWITKHNSAGCEAIILRTSDPFTSQAPEVAAACRTRATDIAPLDLRLKGSRCRIRVGPQQTSHFDIHSNGPQTMNKRHRNKASESKAVRGYTVPISADIQTTVWGDVEVYASSPADALAKVQTQIDAGLLDDDLEMEDVDSGLRIPLELATNGLGADIIISEAEISLNKSEIDPADVLQAEVKALQRAISWNTEKYSKMCEFLKTLMDTN